MTENDGKYKKCVWIRFLALNVPYFMQSFGKIVGAVSEKLLQTHARTHGRRQFYRTLRFSTGDQKSAIFFHILAVFYKNVVDSTQRLKNNFLITLAYMRSNLRLRRTQASATAVVLLNMHTACCTLVRSPLCPTLVAGSWYPPTGEGGWTFGSYLSSDVLMHRNKGCWKHSLECAMPSSADIL